MTAITALPTERARLRSDDIVFLALLASVVPFGLFSYHSGYGHDALEYLVIGRSLRDGHALFDFVPSKGPGIYWLVAGLLGAGLDFGHAQLAGVIAGIYLAVIGATAWTLRRFHDPATAALGTALVALCCWFMELAFLEPEAFVYLAGLAAYACCLRGLEQYRASSWLGCGLALGVGFTFKSVAALYGVAVLACMLLWQRERRLPALLALAAGGATPLALSALCFAVRGRAADYWTWTFYFPVFEYPSNTYFVARLYTKLLFFVVLFAGSVLYALRPARRAAILGHRPSAVALIFGLCASAALLKTQASHYFFPGATFLCMFSTRALRVGLARLPARVLALGAGPCVILLATTVLVYRPNAPRRVLRSRDFSADGALQAYLQQRVPPGARMIAVRNSTYLYWLAHRYPSLPLINMEVQSTYYLATHPGALLRALDDPALQLIELDPQAPQFEDSLLPKNAAAQAQVLAFEHALAQRFVRDPAGPAGYSFWLRRSSNRGASR